VDIVHPMVRSPIKWVGGKSRLRKYIIAMIPEDHTCYVEPFGGAAWVLLGKPPSKVEVYNDLHDELVNLFRVIKEKPDKFIASFDLTLVARSEYERLAKLDPNKLSDIERAHRFYYLVMAGWGGESEYFRFQTSISDGGHGNRLIGAIKSLRKRIEPVYQRLKTVIIENMDWKDIISKYDSAETVFYLDPPYPENKVNYGFNMRSLEEHIELWKRLGALSGRWILSTYDKPKLRRMMQEVLLGKKLFFYPIQAYSGMKKGKSAAERVKNRELLVTNFPATKEFHELIAKEE